ncbi:hypothetical protein [Pseudomonas sp. 14P_8.1_Bac3]|uniref:hypothetical protein n=1 Tax=Pseudomonas sp. 14P_8.1_Bac3 TaxID=2971621 RepID=UPI003965C34B
MIANPIGLLSQASEATAGLIGNNIVALRRRTELFEEVQPPTLCDEQVPIRSAFAAGYTCFIFLIIYSSTGP